ncbi:MAG: DUF1592 domain-containing protein [Bryobacteraceae bacterium]|nr:DUF1592 domain-containing protein [Bryobacteraceae bacterium]
MRFALFLAVSLTAPAIASADSFSEDVYPVLDKAGCAGCHNSGGVASATRLHFPERDAPTARIESFGRSLVALVNRERPEESLLLTKPANRVRHTGGERIKPGSPQEAVLRKWVQTLADLSPEEVAEAKKEAEEHKSGRGTKAPGVVLRRLTHSQYNNTVRDLLGDQTAPANRFPPEDFVNGFKNQYESQNVSPLQVEAYSLAAERLARSAFRGGDTRGLIPCKPSAACRSQFIRDFGLRAFRRPLDAAEQKRYEQLFALETDFMAGAQLVLEAMLQSTSFVFRLDQTSNPAWQPYATASRLSYALWDTMPDEALMNAAARGELSTSQGIEKTARKMIEDPRAREALNEFVSQWLRFDRVLTTARNRRRYPRFNRESAFAMTEEARQFIGDLVWNDRDFMEAFTAPYGFVNADLAGIYGVPAPEKAFERVPFPPESERAGLLGQALFLALTAKPDDTSPTARGLFVREQFLCQHVPPPPPGVDTNLPPVSEARPMTNRERMQRHVTDASCSACHNLVDPIGFGFEKFDAIGARREMAKLFFADNEHDRRAPPKIVELALDTSGSLAGVPDSNFTSPRELGAVLAKTPQCQECVVKQYFRYTVGRMETLADRPVIQRVFKDFRDSQFRFKELIISLVRTREFPDLGGRMHAASNHQAR